MSRKKIILNNKEKAEIRKSVLEKFAGIAGYKVDYFIPLVIKETEKACLNSLEYYWKEENVVSVSWLKKWCKKRIRKSKEQWIKNENQYEHGKVYILEDLLSAVRKEARK